jgi:NADP-dependent 3-hydroxy acid dehydrogenase YdfG
MSKTAFITGATSGIGKAIAEEFSAAGYRIIITGRREERLTQLADELKGEVYPLRFDVRDRLAVNQVIDSLPEEWKTIDILVNNAGLALGLSELSEGDVEDWEQMIDTNVKGLLYVTRKISPTMVERGSGHIVNVSSIAGKEVYAYGNVYCGTKHMVDALTKAMRTEMAKSGVRVSAVNPGAVETEFSIVRFHGNLEKANTVYQGFENLVAKDVAEAVLFMVDRPDHVNINELTIMSTAQPNAGTIYRK